MFAGRRDRRIGKRHTFTSPVGDMPILASFPRHHFSGRSNDRVRRVIEAQPLERPEAHPPLATEPQIDAAPL